MIATGDHRAATEEEIEEMLGPVISRSIKIVSHDCHDSSGMAFFGTTKRGLPVYVNKIVGSFVKKLNIGQSTIEVL